MSEKKYGFWPNKRSILIGLKTFIIASIIFIISEYINGFILLREGYGTIKNVLFLISQAGVMSYAVTYLVYQLEVDRAKKERKE